MVAANKSTPFLPEDTRLDVDPSFQDQQLGPQGAQAEQAAATPWHNKLLKVVGSNMHYFTFIPLIVMSVLKNVNLFLAALVCSCLVLTVLLISFLCFRAGHVKVFPKPFDLFNLALYGSMIPLSLAAHDWLLLYVSLLINAANALFMWATILLPCTDNFVMHTVRDRVPPSVVTHPLITRMALLIALTWATALAIMTGGAIIDIVARLHPTSSHHLAAVIASNVLGFGPLLLAVPIQFAISHIYRKRLQAALRGAAESQQQRKDIEEQHEDGALPHRQDQGLGQPGTAAIV